MHHLGRVWALGKDAYLFMPLYFYAMQFQYCFNSLERDTPFLTELTQRKPVVVILTYSILRRWSKWSKWLKLSVDWKWKWLSIKVVRTHFSWSYFVIVSNCGSPSYECFTMWMSLCIFAQRGRSGKRNFFSLCCISRGARPCYFIPHNITAVKLSDYSTSVHAVRIGHKSLPGSLEWTSRSRATVYPWVVRSLPENLVLGLAACVARLWGYLGCLCCLSILSWFLHYTRMKLAR